MGGGKKRKHISIDNDNLDNDHEDKCMNAQDADCAIELTVQRQKRRKHKRQNSTTIGEHFKKRNSNELISNMILQQQGIMAKEEQELSQSGESDEPENIFKKVKIITEPDQNV